MKKALFWDFDGTLVYSEPTFFNALRTAFQRNRLECSEEDIRVCLHRACTWYAPEISYVGSTGAKWWDRLFFHLEPLYKKYGIPLETANDMNVSFKENALDPKTYTLYEDAVPALEKCSELGFQNYILSNNFPELPVVAARLGLSDSLEGYVISANVGYEKPRRELFEYARRVAGYPDECYMIGDNPVADIKGGKAAGMRTVLVHRQGDFETDYHCAALSDIPSLWTPGGKAGR